MAVIFGNIPVIRRGKEMFYLFSEAKRTLFSSIAEDYLLNAMQYLGVEVLICTEDEGTFFQNFLPSGTGSSGLISEHNLLRLYTMLLNSRQAESTMPTFRYQFPLASNSIPSGFSPGEMQVTPWPIRGRSGEVLKGNCSGTSSLSRDDNNRSTVHCQPGSETSLSADAHESDGQHLATSGGSKESLSEVHVESDASSKSQEPPIAVSEDLPADQASVSSEALSEKNEKRKPTLREEEMSAKLRSEFCELRKFYSAELNFDREGGALQSSTIAKLVERVSRFLWFCKNVKNLEPELSHCADPQLIQDFVHYLRQERDIKPITCSRYISALINATKVPLTSDGNNGQDDLNGSLEKIRAIQRQLERLSRKERVDDLARKPQLEKVVYAELLEVCRELKWEVTEKTGLSQARSSMNLCLLLLYCSANPGRVKEYITLRISKGQSDDQCRGENFICFKEDGTVVLFEDAYKTRPTYGPNRTDLTPLTFLTYHLKCYCTKMRPLLLAGKDHDFFFVNNRGDAFSHTSFSAYVSALFEKYLSLRLTTADIRKAVVNHFLTLPESGDYSLRESFATLMKHSVRTQKRFYDERPLAQKKSKALDLLSSMASRSLGEDSVEVVSDEDEEGHLEYLPLPGQFVALVAANSSKSSPECFVAKVLRLSEDRKTAYLADFSEVEPGKFKLDAGKSYREEVKALIYPIDLEYSHSNGVYELRTPKLDIHRRVYKQ